MLNFQIHKALVRLPANINIHMHAHFVVLNNENSRTDDKKG